MGLVDWAVGKAVSAKLSSYTSAHPVPRDMPAADVARLEDIATSIAKKAPALADSLKNALPPSLPPESSLTPEMRNAAQKLGAHLMNLVPAHLSTDVAQARQTASQKGMDYGTVVANYGKLLTALPATKHFAADIGPALVAFATAHKISPAELGKFQANLDKLDKMIPLVAMAGGDAGAKLTKLADLVALAKLDT